MDAATEATAADFVDLVLADDELVRDEFEAIIAAGWGDDHPRVPEPPRKPSWPHHPANDHMPSRGLGPREGPSGGVEGYERGPPKAGRVVVS